MTRRQWEFLPGGTEAERLARTLRSLWVLSIGLGVGVVTMAMGFVGPGFVITVLTTVLWMMLFITARRPNPWIRVSLSRGELVVRSGLIVRLRAPFHTVSLGLVVVDPALNELCFMTAEQRVVLRSRHPISELEDFQREFEHARERFGDERQVPESLRTV